MRILTSLLIVGVLVSGCDRKMTSGAPTSVPASSPEVKAPTTLDTEGKPCTNALATSVSFTCDGTNLQTAIDEFLTSHPCVVLGREIRYAETEGRLFLLEANTKKKECRIK